MSDKTATHWSIDTGSKYPLEYPDEELEYVAVIAAEDYHGDHDGWEVSWPVVFTFYNTDDVELGKVEVELDFEPSFSACELPKET